MMEATRETAGGLLLSKGAVQEEVNMGKAGHIILYYIMLYDIILYYMVPTFVHATCADAGALARSFRATETMLVGTTGMSVQAHGLHH